MDRSCRKGHASERAEKNGCTRSLLWRLGCKNWLTPTCGKTSRVPRKWRYLSTLWNKWIMMLRVFFWDNLCRVLQMWHFWPVLQTWSLCCVNEKKSKPVCVDLRQVYFGDFTAKFERQAQTNWCLLEGAKPVVCHVIAIQSQARSEWFCSTALLMYE